MADEFEEQSRKLYEAAKVFPLVDGVAPVARVGDEARAEAYFFGARRLRERAGDVAGQSAVPRDKLLALAEELGNEADEADARAEIRIEEFGVFVAQVEAGAKRSAESRLRAIIDG
jgi:hypothetical protein